MDEIQDVGEEDLERRARETLGRALEGLVGDVLSVAGVETDEQQVQAIASKIETGRLGQGERIQQPRSRPRRSTWHVTPTQDGQWRVIRENASRASSVHDTKDKAVSAAKDIARKRSKSQVVLHRQDGTIQKAHSYGA